MNRFILKKQTIISYLFVVLMCISSITMAQRSELYALKSSSGETNIELVLVNPSDASLSFVTNFPQLKGITVGTSIFNQGEQHYVFWGVDAENKKRLYSVQTNDGNISAEPQLILLPNATNLVELEYDLRNQILYGLSFDIVAKKQYLVTVNLIDGSIQIVNEIAGIESIVTGSSTFDSNTGQYLFLGIDNTQTKYLYQIEAATATILNKIPVQDNITALQFDVVQNKLYGLNFESNAIHFVEIDQTSGAINDKGAISGLKSYFMSSSVYQQDRSSFAFMGTDQENKKRLYVIETPTGDLRSDAVLNDVIVELQADNTVFAAQRYGNNTATGINTFTLPEGMRLHPNPIKNKLTIENRNNLTISNLRVSDLSGKVILQIQDVQNTVDMSRLSAGVYVIDIETPKGSYQQKVVKQ